MGWCRREGLNRTPPSPATIETVERARHLVVACVDPQDVETLPAELTLNPDSQIDVADPGVREFVLGQGVCSPEVRSRPRFSTNRSYIAPTNSRPTVSTSP